MSDISTAPPVTPEDWAAITDGLRAVGETTVFGDPNLSDFVRGSGIRYLNRLFSIGTMLVDNFDPAYPQLVNYMSPWLNWGAPCPSCAYLYAPLHGDHTYRISGQRGSAAIFDLEIKQGDAIHLMNIGSFSGRQEFSSGEGGEIEIILSRQEQEGNWLALPDGPAHLILRQYFGDWDREEPAVLTIERDGAMYPAPPPTAVDLAEQRTLLLQWLRIASMALGAGRDQYLAAEPGTAPFRPVRIGTEDDVGLVDMHYGQGHYECGPDEAVVLEAEPPEALFWEVCLGTHFWDSMDWHVRSTSINGHQAARDADGVFRAVIAHADPGVANWLDTGGHARGLITVRYLRPESKFADPSFTVVPLADLDRHLPPATQRVTAEQRSEALRRRMLAVRRRNNRCL